VNVTGTAKTPAYDLNGNTLTDGAGKSYVWDAENRLTKIIYADNSSTEFQYNGISQRVRVTEKNAANATLSDKRYLWAGGNQPSEERDSSGTTVIKRYFPQGEQIPAAAAPLNKLFYTRDHLGNIRELTDSNGTLQTRYDYDIWGKRIKLSGTLDTEVGYTGHHHHAKSELILTWFRAYDAEMGRWLSADPMENVTGKMAEMLPEGSNLYAYVGNDPINGFDPMGLVCWGLPNGLAGNDKEFKDAYYKEARKGALAFLAVPAALGAAGPATVYHFTSSAGYSAIISQGVIRAGSGLFGRGVYVSAFSSPFIARLMGAQSTEKCIKIAAEGLKKAPTLIPGAYRILQDVSSKYFK
jgi:RHS repeat-associated protein